MKRLVIVMLLGLLAAPTLWAADSDTQNTPKPAVHSHKGKGAHHHRRHNQTNSKTKNNKQTDVNGDK